MQQRPVRSRTHAFLGIGFIRIAGFLLIFLTNLNGCSGPSRDSQPASIDLTEIYGHADNAEPSVHSARTMIVFTNFEDFTCSICLESYSEFLNAASALKENNALASDIVVVVLRNDQKDSVQVRIVRAWLQSRKWAFKNTLVNHEIFRKYNIKKTALVSVNLDGQVNFLEEFPLADHRFQEITNALSKR